jgi:hypothetical protein
MAIADLLGKKPEAGSQKPEETGGGDALTTDHWPLTTAQGCVISSATTHSSNCSDVSSPSSIAASFRELHFL